MDDIISPLGKKVNEQEIRILEIIGKKPCKLSEISRALNMDFKSTWTYCNKLFEKGIISLTPPPGESKKGSPVWASMILANDEGIIYSVLNKMRAKKRKISLNEFYNLLNETQLLWDDEERKEKLSNLLFLEIGSEFIKKEVSLTKKAKEFLKEQDKKRKLKAMMKRDSKGKL